MKINILDRSKKKKFTEELSELGIEKIQELLIKTGSERVRAYSGSLSSDEIMKLWRLLPIEGIGLYVGKDITDRHGKKEVRLSIEGLHLWKEQISKKTLVLTESQEKDWFHGKNIEFSSPKKIRGFVAVKSTDEKDFIGTGKITDDGLKLLSFLPKERRRRENIIA